MRAVTHITYGAVLRLQVEAGHTFTRCTEGVMRDADLAIIGTDFILGIGTESEQHFFFLDESVIGIPRDRATLRAAYSRMVASFGGVS